MNREGSVITIAAAIFLSWFLFRKSRNKKGSQLPIISDSCTTESESSTETDLAGNYEVFLSFRGTDTRHGFTDFLYTYLVGAGIRTFRDDNELRIGEEIGPDLLKAIKDSKISIPIFSKDYAFSKWCLHELAQIVECHKNDGQRIFPIFYDVDASDVRNQKGSYEMAFNQHKKNFDEKTVQEWRKALKIVGQLKGYELEKETNGLEGELVKKVVREALLKLRKNYTSVPGNLVGMVDQVDEMKRLLKVDSTGIQVDSSRKQVDSGSKRVESGGIQVVGVHGMGGIGKTTIAKVIYNQLCDKFDYCCFLEDVRAKAKQQHDGLINLQKQLVSKILETGYVEIDDVENGVNIINNAVQKKKGFIVLDDVDEKSQFDKLVGDCDKFGSGSRLIVTTRNKEILHAIEVTYERKGLRDVYRSYEPGLMSPDYALQLFSKYAFMRDSPPEDYLILSEEVTATAAGLPLVLVTLGSLFFGNEDKDLWEEKLRQLEKIPHEEVLKKLRISFEALSDQEKQIFLDIACLFIGEDKVNPFYMWDDCEFYPRNGINTLVLRSLVKLGDDDSFMMHDQLRDLGRQIVREECMNEAGGRSRSWHHEEARDILERCTGTKNIEALCLDVRAEYTDTSDNGTICLRGQDFGRLPNLRFLRVGSADLDGDFKHHLSKLRWLNWRCAGMFKATNFHPKNLVILDLSRSTITDDWKGWNEIKMAKKLKVLNLSFSKCVTRAPNLSPFQILERLSLNGCEDLKKVDWLIGNLRMLRFLDLSNCNSLESVDCSSFRILKSLNLQLCEKLHKVTGLQWLECLTNLNTSSCGRLMEIEGLDKMETLENLDLRDCKSLERALYFFNFKKLCKLDIRGCGNLTEIQVPGLECLEYLYIRGCGSVDSSEDFSSSEKWGQLDLWGCDTMAEIQFLGVEYLEHLDMLGPKSIKSLKVWSISKMLSMLVISGCEKLVEIQGLDTLGSLVVMAIEGCTSIEILPDLSGFQNLRVLNVKDCVKLREIRGLGELKYLTLLNASGCEKLVEIQGLDTLESLEVLVIRGCTSIEILPDLSGLQSLRELNATDCVNLREIRGLEELKYLTLLHVTGIKRLENIRCSPNTTIWQSYLITAGPKLVMDKELQEWVTMQDEDEAG